MNRPEKVTKFLKHMFPTETDRLVFEIIYKCSLDYSHGINRKGYKFELAMPTNDYYIKMKFLYNTSYYYTDANTASEIHDALCTYKGTTIIDLTNSTKTQTKQLEFINRLSTAIYKTALKSHERFFNVNSYIFLVNKNLCQKNKFFKCYSLKDYNDDDYTFDENDKKEYMDYLRNLDEQILQCNTFEELLKLRSEIC